MAAVLTLLALLVVSTIITRVAAAIFMASGLSAPYARFQARSAFTGVGFTTSEAEAVVNHPVRRKVVATLMLLGNLGVGAVIASLVLSFDGASAFGSAQRSLVLAGGALVIVFVARRPIVERALVRLTRRAMRLGHGEESDDRSTITHLGGDHDVIELALRDHDWLTSAELGRLRLKDEGVVVLGLERGGVYTSLPDRAERLMPDDVVVVYGPRPVLEDLDRRRQGTGGELAHVDAVMDHRHRSESPPT